MTDGDEDDGLAPMPVPEDEALDALFRSVRAEAERGRIVYRLPSNIDQGIEDYATTLVHMPDWQYCTELQRIADRLGKAEILVLLDTVRDLFPLPRRLLRSR